jgi:hypothetical protein
MGLFRKSKVAPPAQTMIEGNAPTYRFMRGDVEVDLAGMRFYDAAVTKVAGRRPSDLERVSNIVVVLDREPNNQHDPNAIAVHKLPHGQIGYVPKELAAQLAPAIDTVAQQIGGPFILEAPAELEAYWDDGDREPDSVEVRLMLDAKLRVKPRG